MTALLAFAVAAVVTYALRSSITVAGDRVARSAHLATLTSLVTPAVLAAMIAGALFVHHGEVAVPPVAEILAVVVAFVVARRTGNFGYALAAGLPAYWLATALGLA